MADNNATDSSTHAVCVYGRVPSNWCSELNAVKMDSQVSTADNAQHSL